jgi:hypothetical protein
MNGLTAPVCSLICLAFAHNASDTDCGSNLGKCEVDGEEGREDGGVGNGLELELELEVEGGAKVARTSKISSSYCNHQLGFLAVLRDWESLPSCPSVHQSLGRRHLPSPRGLAMTWHLSSVHHENGCRPTLISSGLEERDH